MFNSNYFNPRYWAARYWPKVGADPSVNITATFTMDRALSMSANKDTSLAIDNKTAITINLRN